MDGKRCMDCSGPVVEMADRCFLCCRKRFGEVRTDPQRKEEREASADWRMARMDAARDEAFEVDRLWFDDE